jgi:hypothetical protein
MFSSHSGLDYNDLLHCWRLICERLVLHKFRIWVRYPYHIPNQTKPKPNPDPSPNPNRNPECNPNPKAKPWARH